MTDVFFHACHFLRRFGFSVNQCQNITVRSYAILPKYLKQNIVNFSLNRLKQD